MSIEEWIWNRELRGMTTFSADELRNAFPQHSVNVQKSELSRLVVRGRILSVYRGFYVIIPVQYRLKRIVPPEYYIDELMRYVGKPYYVGLLSASAMHGATHQRTMQMQVVTVAPRLKTSFHPGMDHAQNKSRLELSHSDS